MAYKFGVTFERSAGVIVFNNSVGGRRYLLLDYGRHWDWPKGHVEPGEDDPSAAWRELAEETGLTREGGVCDFVPGFVQEISYIFRGRSGKLIKKVVIFYMAESTATTVSLSHEHVAYEWLTYEPAIERLTFATARAVLKAAHAHLPASPASAASSESIDTGARSGGLRPG